MAESIKKGVKRVKAFKKSPEAKISRTLSEEGRYMLKDVSQEVSPTILQLLKGNEKKEAINVLQKELTDTVEAALKTGASNLPLDVEIKIKKLLERENIISRKQDNAERLEKIKNLFKTPSEISHYDSIKDTLISRKLLDTTDNNTMQYVSLLSQTQKKETIAKINTIISDIYLYIGNLGTPTCPGEIKDALDSMKLKKVILTQSLSNPTADEIEQNANSIIDTLRKIAASLLPEDKELLLLQLEDLQNTLLQLKQELQKLYSLVKSNFLI